eukprot:3685693-Amphidinium_carterae.1
MKKTHELGYMQGVGMVLWPALMWNAGVQRVHCQRGLRNCGAQHYMAGVDGSEVVLLLGIR